MPEAKHPRSAVILYGTETGNAQDVAEELGSMAERLHFTALVSEMNNFQAVGRNSSQSIEKETRRSMNY